MIDVRGVRADVDGLGGARLRGQREGSVTHRGHRADGRRRGTPSGWTAPRSRRRSRRTRRGLGIGGRGSGAGHTPPTEGQAQGDGRGTGHPDSPAAFPGDGRVRIGNRTARQRAGNCPHVSIGDRRRGSDPHRVTASSSVMANSFAVDCCRSSACGGGLWAPWGSGQPWLGVHRRSDDERTPGADCRAGGPVARSGVGPTTGHPGVGPQYLKGPTGMVDSERAVHASLLRSWPTSDTSPAGSAPGRGRRWRSARTHRKRGAVQGASEADQRARRPWRERRGLWTAVALAVAVVGVVGTVIGSTAMTQAADIRQQQHVAASSMAMASMLGLTIQHEQDLAISAQAFLKGSPDATQTQFSQWITAVQAFERYPELQAIAITSIVPASQLGDFLVRTGTVAPGSTVAPSSAVVPPGNRPFYCLRAMAEARAGAPEVPAGVDLCQEPVGRVLVSARNSGQEVVVPFGSGADTGLGIGSAVYRGDAPPDTVAARQAAFIGWVGEQIDPRRVLDAALVGNPHTSVALRFGTGRSAVAFTAGSAPRGGQSSTIVLDDGWSVRMTFPADEWKRLLRRVPRSRPHRRDRPQPSVRGADLPTRHGPIPRPPARTGAHRPTPSRGAARLIDRTSQPRPHPRPDQPGDGPIATAPALRWRHSTSTSTTSRRSTTPWATAPGTNC